MKEENKTIALTRDKLRQRQGEGQNARDPEKEMREVESQLSQLTQEICQVAQKMKTRFGVDPTHRKPTNEEEAVSGLGFLMSQDSCSVAD